MRFASSVTSLSWIPSEAVTGLSRAGFDVGITHYDPPPPEAVGDLDALRAADRFRFANHLAAWIEVEDGVVVGCGYHGAGTMGSTTVRVGPARATFRATALPDLRRPPVLGDGWVRFVQTTGGRTGLPAPRRVRRRPYVQLRAPLVWTTLALTLHVDGRAAFEVVGASRFPRHWIYGPDGKLHSKVGLAHFEDWWRTAFGRHSPWGDEESPAIVTAAETALEREMSARIMQGGERPSVFTLEAGDALTRQGERGTDMFLLLDGVLRVEVDGRRLAELGPGAVVGERAALEGGARTATLVAVTPCRVAVADPALVDRDDAVTLQTGHRRELTG